MGYYTNYKLTIVSGDASRTNKVEGVDENGNPSYVYVEGADITADEILIEASGTEYHDECKWYDHEIDMRKISKKYPNLVLCLHGEGEENDDIWKKYFKDGLMQDAHAIVTFPEYDPNKLQ